jgi:hypothetical protein
LQKQSVIKHIDAPAGPVDDYHVERVSKAVNAVEFSSTNPVSSTMHIKAQVDAYRMQRVTAKPVYASTDKDVMFASFCCWVLGIAIKLLELYSVCPGNWKC